MSSEAGLRVNKQPCCTEYKVKDLNLIYFLIGAVVMFLGLVGIGITQPRGTSVTLWCFLYVAISVIFDGFVIAALIFQYSWLIEALLGASAGAATGLGFHSAHHVLEERRTTTKTSDVKA